jgi:hypothetical protein
MRVEDVCGNVWRNETDPDHTKYDGWYLPQISGKFAVKTAMTIQLNTHGLAINPVASGLAAAKCLSVGCNARQKTFNSNPGEFPAAGGVNASRVSVAGMHADGAHSCRGCSDVLWVPTRGCFPNHPLAGAFHVAQVITFAGACADKTQNGAGTVPDTLTIGGSLTSVFKLPLGWQFQPTGQYYVHFSASDTYDYKKGFNYSVGRGSSQAAALACLGPDLPSVVLKNSVGVPRVDTCSLPQLRAEPSGCARPRARAHRGGHHCDRGSPPGHQLVHHQC